MTYCCAFGCRNSSERKKKKRKDGVTFHKLPKDPDQRARWIEAINRPNWEPTVHSALCSAHFPETAMDRTSQSCVRLREGAVPSIFAGVARATKDGKAPVKKSCKPAEPTKKISFEELIRQRGKFHRELTEVLEELIQIRKERKRLNQIKRRIGSKVESLKKLLSEDTSLLRMPRKELEMELEDAQRRLVETEEEIATSTEQKDALYTRKTDLECKLKYLPVPLKFKLDTMAMPSSDPKAHGAAGSSKRPGSDPEEGEKKKRKPTKKLKTAEDMETERDVPESFLEDPFEMIEIEEPRIKEEIFETEEFSEMKSEEILINDGSTQGKSHFETIFCTPGIIKEERPDDVETPCGDDTAETDTTVPEFVQTVIKSEPPEEEDDDDEDEEGETELRVSAPLMWRCPLVSCPEMFSSELEMYQHLNLNHVVKGPGSLSSKSKKASTSRPVTSSPSVAISSAGGSVFLTSSSSSPRLFPVMVPSSQSVPSSCCGPVTVTTTLSYSSLTNSLSPIVTTVASSSPVLSLSCATLISSASPSVTSVPSGFTACPPASSPVALSTSVPDVSASPSVSATNFNSLTSANPHPVTTASQGLQKLIVAPISDLDSSSTGPKKFLLLAPQHSQQPQQKSATKTSKAQPVQIFHPSESSTEDLPPCATDDSEMFSISLARFPQNRRVPIKRKLIDVVDCMKQKNISPDKLLIAFYENSSDSRTM